MSTVLLNHPPHKRSPNLTLTLLSAAAAILSTNPISFGMSSYGRAPGGRDHGQGGGGGDDAARARASNAQASSSAGGHVGSIGWQAPEVIADRVSLEGGQGPPAAMGGGAERCVGGHSGHTTPRHHTHTVVLISIELKPRGHNISVLGRVEKWFLSMAMDLPARRN